MFYLTQTSFGYKFKQLRCGLEIERSLYLKKNSFFFSQPYQWGPKQHRKHWDRFQDIFSVYHRRKKARLVWNNIFLG